MEIYPILNKPGKGKYVFIFILNERAVSIKLENRCLCAELSLLPE